MIVHAATQSLVFKADDPLMLRGLIPHSRSLDHPDFNIAIKHTLEATRVLRNIGIPAPAPIRSDYKWPGKYLKPFSHQVDTAEFLTLHKRAFVLSEMGTAKTSSALWAVDWLITHKYVHKVLVIAPLSTLDRVWAQEIFDVLMHRNAVILHGSREKRIDMLAIDVDFYIINHDGLLVTGMIDVLRKRSDIDLVIVDEGADYRNSSTTRYKKLKQMLRPDQRLWWMTGTPCPNAPTDAWAQAKLVCPERVPEYFGTFKRATMMQVTQYKWVPRPEAYDIAYKAMQPAVLFKKKDCLDLPPVVFEERQCTLTDEQAAAFKEMKSTMIAEAKTTQITAVNAADKILKLRQILCGSVKDPLTDTYITIDHKPRAKLLLDCIGEASAKVIVVVPFKGIIQALAKEIGKVYSVGVLNGDVSPNERNKIVGDFKNTPDPHVLLCHPKVMSHGLNLTEADVLIFYAPIYSNDQAQQVVERFNRPGQKNSMTVIKMAAHKLEWSIYDMLNGKQVTQSNILKLYASITE